MKRIDATIYFGLDGASTQTTIFIEDDATLSEIEERLKEEALKEIEFEWREVKIKTHEVERVENLMYKGCEPHWHCIHCDNYWPFHCYSRKDLEQMTCPEK